MSKRPAVDLMALTSDQALPMAEAMQRTAPTPARKVTTELSNEAEGAKRMPAVKTANLEALAFKVSPQFRKRFRQRAVEADLKLNELLFAALDAWEEGRGLKK